MGLCASEPEPLEGEEAVAEQRKIAKKMDKKMKNKKFDDSQISKVLFLGAGESGKSTLFKQMVSIYGNGFTEEERRGLRQSIVQNVFDSIATLVIQSRKLHAKFGDTHYSEDCHLAAKSLLEVTASDLTAAERVLTPEIAENIQKLWNETGIRNTFSHRALFDISDGCAYLLDRVLEICKENYVPTVDDVLHVRVRTTGIMEQFFTIENSKIHVFDVGGQRNERKKWLHCFENVHALIFVSALSGYDQVLYEDKITNRMKESLDVFTDIIAKKYFEETSLILFLNKRDIFEQKIPKSRVRVNFPEFPLAEEGNVEFAIEFFQKKFLAIAAEKGKEIFVHVTTATDTKNMEYVLAALQNILLKGMMTESGMAL